MAAAQRLELGLLVRGDHIVVRTEANPAPHAGVEVQDPGRLGCEVGVAGEDPRPVTPRLDGVGVQPAAHRRRRDRRNQPLPYCLAGELGRAPPRQRHLALLGRLARQCLDPGHNFGAEPTGPTRPGPVGQPGEPLLAEPFPPPRGHVDAHADARRDIHVLQAIGGQQHDPGPHHRRMRRQTRPRPFLENRPLLARQPDHEWRPTRHGNLRDDQGRATPKLHRCTYRHQH